MWERVLVFFAGAEFFLSEWGGFCGIGVLCNRQFCRMSKEKKIEKLKIERNHTCGWVGAQVPLWAPPTRKKNT